MPVFEIHAPYFELLPQTLYDGAFELWLAPGSHAEFGRAWGYYFHDRQWFCEGRTLLGWSREILHYLKADFWGRHFHRGTKPNWLCGHAFQLMDKLEPCYMLSGTRKRQQSTQLVEYALQAIDTLTKADLSVDQWGGSEDRHFFSAIQKHLEERKETVFGLADHVDRYGHLEAFVRWQNHVNKIWHPSYPTRTPSNSSGIGQTYMNSILSAAFQNTTFTGAATIYNALHSANPSDTSQGTEAAYTSYARQAITCNSTNFANASAGAITYSPVITFPTNTGSSETETATSWQAASSGGTQPNWWGTLSSSVAVGNGIAPQFNASAIVTSGV